MAAAAASYPEIERITTSTGQTVDVDGRDLEYRNTNHLVGQDGWDILLSKTGFTKLAGRCLIMRLNTGVKTIIVVLLNATDVVSRTIDAQNVRRYLAGEPPLLVKAVQKRRVHRTSNRTSAKARNTRSVARSDVVAAARVANLR
jgi:D-alanyl-D-alanine carboxypeptidase/D-alanyl-D-alanine endopeptidase (penicillin-binding protein 7)